jgi:hypothetical protein
VYEQDVNAAARGPNAYPPAGDSGDSGAKDKARQAGEAAKQGAQEVAGTAKEQGREVAREARNQARSVAADLRTSVTGQAHTQNRRLADGLRQMSDQFAQMGPDDSSPAGQVVRRLGDGGRRAADYLEDRGPEGLLDDVQEFARRKPGTFLLLAAAAGFAVGRLGRTAFAAAQDDKDGGSDAYRESTGLYRSRTATEGYSTGYPAPVAEPMPPAPAYPTAPVTPVDPVPPVAPTYQPGADR